MNPTESQDTMENQDEPPNNDESNAGRRCGPSDCSGRVLQPREQVETGDKILLVGGAWITSRKGGFLAKDYIQVRRPNVPHHLSRTAGATDAGSEATKHPA